MVGPRNDGDLRLGPTAAQTTPIQVLFAVLRRNVRNIYVSRVCVRCLVVVCPALAKNMPGDTAGAVVVYDGSNARDHALAHMVVG